MAKQGIDRQGVDRIEECAQVGWAATMASSVAAAFGVQSHKNRLRDFEHGDVKKFVISGITLTFVILFSLIGLVQIVLTGA
tara:strand:- start:568 stop:810 length:243 start_codon:yes stop_codon:yes gene_type:complete